MKWFRLYHEILDDPKVQRLDPAMFRFWINFMCLANRQDERGHVQKSIEVIAFELRTSDEEAAASIEYLTHTGLIDATETGLRPHNWNGRQYKSDDVTSRVTTHREKNNVSKNPDSSAVSQGESLHATTVETLHETPDETSQETPRETLHETLVPSARDRVQITDTENREQSGVARVPARDAADAAPPPQDVPADLPEEPKPKRKQRIPDGFVPSAALRTWAETDLRMSPAAIDSETEKFRDHFRGSGATKLDWPATWRNWMRNATEGKYGRPATTGPSGPATAPPPRGQMAQTTEDIEAGVARFWGASAGSRGTA